MTVGERGSICGGVVTLKAKNLIAAYGSYVALDVPFLELTGRRICIIGHNGSGKSTFIKTLLDLLVPRQGSVRVYAGSGQDASRQLLPEKHMAFSPEGGSVFADIYVRDYLELWSRLKKRDPLYYRTGGAELLEQLELVPLLGRLGRELSKGQRRRVQIMAGFLCDPRFFLFDEPFDGLDLRQGSQLLSIMRNGWPETGMLISSHRMEAIEKLADQVILLLDGRMIATGGVDAVARELCPLSVTIFNGKPLTDTSRKSISTLLPELDSHLPEILVEPRPDGQLAILGPRSAYECFSEMSAQGKLAHVTWRERPPTLADALTYLDKTKRPADYTP